MMTRFLYRCLIRAYPHGFRSRFGDELLLAFDDARASHGAPRLLANALITLFYQWLRHSAMVQPLPAAPIGPTFHIFEPRPLSPAAVLLGATTALLLLGTMQYAVRHWSSWAPVVGTYRGSLQPNATGIAVGQSALGAVVIGAGPMADEWTLAALDYIAHLPLLRALDHNADGHFSAGEIMRAPDVLRVLDQNHSNSLSASECGAPPNWDKRFMQEHPVHRVLDTNADTVIDAWELRGAAILLRKLDLTRDGTLHPAELLPDRIVGALLERRKM